MKNLVLFFNTPTQFNFPAMNNNTQDDEAPTPKQATLSDLTRLYELGVISKEKLQQLIEKVCLDVDQVSELRKRRRPTTDMGVELEDQEKKIAGAPMHIRDSINWIS